MRKKFFAVFMCLVMVLAVMPAVAWADEGQAQSEIVCIPISSIKAINADDQNRKIVELETDDEGNCFLWEKDYFTMCLADTTQCIFAEKNNDKYYLIDEVNASALGNMIEGDVTDIGEEQFSCYYLVAKQTGSYDISANGKNITLNITNPKAAFYNKAGITFDDYIYDSFIYNDEEETNTIYLIVSSLGSASKENLIMKFLDENENELSIDENIAIEYKKDIEKDNEKFYVYEVTITKADRWEPLRVKTSYTIDSESWEEAYTELRVLNPNDIFDDGSILDKNGKCIDGDIEIDTSLKPEDNFFYIRYEGVEGKKPCKVSIEKRILNGYEKVEEYEIVEDSEANKNDSCITISDYIEDKNVRKVSFNKYIGHNDLKITFIIDGGDPIIVTAVFGIEIQYEKAAVKCVVDQRCNEDDILDNGKILRKKTLPIVSENQSKGEESVYYNDLGTSFHTESEDGPVIVGEVARLDIILNPGYTVEKIVINDETAEYDATSYYYYAPYNAAGERMNAALDRFSGFLGEGDEDGNIDENGTKVSADKTAVLVCNSLGGYNKEYGFYGSNDSDPMIIIKADMEKTNAARVELLDSTVSYEIKIDDPKGINTIKIITKEIPEVKDGKVTIIKGEMEVKNEANSSAPTATQSQGLQKLYSNNKIIETVYEINEDIHNEGMVDVVIPVSDASEYDVVWFKDDNTPVPVVSNTTSDGNGITFKTGHFSTYALVKNGASDTPQTPGTPGIPPTSGDAAKLSNAQKESTTAIGSYVDMTEYDADEAAEIKAIQEKAQKDIAAAKTAEEVKAIEEAAKAEIDKIETAAEKAEIALVENTKFKARSLLTKLKGKKAIKIQWNVPKDMKFDGFEVYRSTERYSGFGTEPYFTTEKTSYTNNKGLKKGETYYYKVRGFKYVNDEKVYCDYSYKACRTIR